MDPILATNLKNIYGFDRQEIPNYAVLANSLKDQQQVQKITQEEFDSHIRLLTITAEALKPSMETYREDPEKYYRQARVAASRLAEIAIYRWAFPEYSRIEETEDNKEIQYISI